MIPTRRRNATFCTNWKTEPGWGRAPIAKRPERLTPAPGCNPASLPRWFPSILILSMQGLSLVGVRSTVSLRMHPQNLFPIPPCVVRKGPSLEFSPRGHSYPDASLPWVVTQVTTRGMRKAYREGASEEGRGRPSSRRSPAPLPTVGERPERPRCTPLWSIPDGPLAALCEAVERRMRKRRACRRLAVPLPCPYLVLVLSGRVAADPHARRGSECGPFPHPHQPPRSRRCRPLES